MNKKTLFILFLVLLGIWGLSQMNSEKRNRSFKTNLISIDTAQVTAINLYPKVDNQQEITLQKENGSWFATQGSVTTKAKTGIVKVVLDNIHLIKTKRVTAKKQEKWKEYEVGETNGSRVKVYAGSELLEDFIVGRFSFNQQTRQGLSFVRLTHENEVYEVDGFLSKTLGQGFETFRNKAFLSLTPKDVTQIKLTNTDNSTQIFSLNNGQWQKEGVAIDPTAMAVYLNSIQNLSGTKFADNLDETQLKQYFYKEISILANNGSEAIAITCYRAVPNSTQVFVLQSSQNKGTYFSSDGTDFFEQLFMKLEGF